MYLDGVLNPRLGNQIASATMRFVPWEQGLVENPSENSGCTYRRFLKDLGRLKVSRFGFIFIHVGSLRWPWVGFGSFLFDHLGPCWCDTLVFSQHWQVCGKSVVMNIVFISETCIFTKSLSRAYVCDSTKALPLLPAKHDHLCWYHSLTFRLPDVFSMGLWPFHSEHQT